MKLILLYGPPAVGKLTIAKLLSDEIGFKLLHNHLIQNPITEVFPFENPSNTILVREFRLRILEEAAKSNISLIATFGIAGNNPFNHISDIVSCVERSNGEICLVHLTANKETLLNRVEDQSRKDHGKNLSAETLKEIIDKNADIFNKFAGTNHLSINTTKISPEEAVRKIVQYYKMM